ncbi:CocE/NonD family hydrolase [bacterium]|nr:CocE/NonD family hydrolase [bacterium]
MPGRTRFLLVPLVLLFPALSWSQDEKPASEWKTERKDIAIPMRDGKSLAADLYLPPAPGKYPVVLIQTPYNKKGLGAPFAGGDAAGGEAGRGSFSDARGLLDREHYVYAIVDWRGFYGSKDATGSGPGWRRGQDGYDCVEWLARQGFSDGRIGTWGGSALGGQQFETAIEQPPHLVCCVPLIAAIGQTYERFYENGVLLESHTSTLDRLGFGVSTIVRANPLPGTPAWKLAERLTYHPEKIEVPCLLVTGWWDLFPDAIARTFDDLVKHGGEKTRKHSRLLIGPWDHVSVGVEAQGDRKFPLAAKASAEAAKAFFDRFLRDAENDWEKVPRVRYWKVGDEKWEETDSWTSMKRETETLAGTESGKLLREKPAASNDPAPLARSYTHDPRDPSPTLGGANLPPLKHGPTLQNDLEKRKDVLVYSTGKLAQPLTLEGRAELSFTFSANREDCDFAARLCLVDEDGRSFLLADAVLRAKLREGAEPKPLVPGEKTTLTLRFGSTAVTIGKGKELRVLLSSSNWPRYERNTHTGADHWDEKSALELQVTVFHDSEHGMELKLPRRAAKTGD